MSHKIQDTLPFKIENNILIGEEHSFRDKCVNIGDLILNSFKSTPDFIGQVDAATGEQTTFLEMREKSVKCALWLKKQNIKPGDVIAICTHNHINAYIPLLASLYIGAIANPWSEQSTEASIKYFISQVSPEVIFINVDKVLMMYEVVMELQSYVKLIVFGEVKWFMPLDLILKEFDKTEIEGFSCTKLQSSLDTAIILFSSGTTDLPKSVKISQRSLTLAAEAQIPTICPDDVALWFESLNWITGTLLTIRTILSCIKVVKSYDFEEEKFCQITQKYKVTWGLLETSMFTRLFKFPFLMKYDISSLKKFIVTGSAIRHEVYAGFAKLLPNTSIMVSYGMTETGWLTFQPHTGKAGSSGYVIKNVRLMIADRDTEKPLGPNMHGEIYCKSPIMEDHYKNTETTNTLNSDGWFRSGDVGYYDEDGDVFVTDRIKELIKYKGHHISPTEIEMLLQIHPAVREVTVTAVPHPIDSQHPIAFVTKVSGKNVTKKKLMQLVAENLDDCKKLRAGVIFIKKMPRVSNGKIDRMTLRNMAKSYAKE